MKRMMKLDMKMKMIMRGVEIQAKTRMKAMQMMSTVDADDEKYDVK